MSRLEDELRNALRREQPPAGFAERVLARAAQPRRTFWDFLRLPAFRWAMAGALCLIFVIAGLEYQQQRQERLRGEAAKAQLMQALRITGSKLQFANRRVRSLQDSRFTEKQQ